MRADLLFDLDDPRSADVRRAGAKAARLSRAAAAGLPVLPGVVVASEAGRPAFELGAAALGRGGSGAARLAAMDVPIGGPLLDACEGRVRRLGPPVVVRSSSDLEGDTTWSGAFSSFDDVGVDDLATALRGVWASAFTVDTLLRFAATDLDPGGARLAVLIQPRVEPSCSGTARSRPDGAVEIVATWGPPRNLLSGWDPGVRTVVGPGGEIAGDSPDEANGADDAATRVGVGVLRQVAALAHDVVARVDANLIEWAVVAGRPLLLQLGTSRAPSILPPDARPMELADPVALRVARAACRAPGPLGEALVMPWALGLRRLPSPVASAEPVPQSRHPGADLAKARRWAEELAKEAWQQRAADAAQSTATVIRMLRGPDPRPALAHLRRLRPVDVCRAARLLALIDGVGVAAERMGLVSFARAVWQYGPTDLARLLAGRRLRDDRRGDWRGPVPDDPRAGIGADRWAPFVHAAVMSHGRRAIGQPASPGIGAGAVQVVRPHQRSSLGGRDVIVVERPVPAFAPLLWSAAALVATAGSPAAHLLEVARSLGVPAVVATDLTAAGLTLADLSAGGSFLAAVDGDRGILSVDGAGLQQQG